MAINFDRFDKKPAAGATGNQGAYASAQPGVIEGAPADIDAGLRSHMLRIYNYMGGGLLVSGIAAWLTTGLVTDPATVFNLGLVASLAGLGIILVTSFTINRMSASAVQLAYWSFVTLTGIGLARLGYIYSGEDITKVFLITSAAFGGLSLYGYSTRQDLSGMGAFMVMGLIGLILAMVVNIFLQSAMMGFVISVVGVIVFSGLIAWDTQRLKEEYVAGVGSEATATKHAVWGALMLYLDFINLFRFLLALLGNRD